jgi:hypothetical protein
VIWRKDRPECERPADDATREIQWVQGGIPVARMLLIPPSDPGGHEWLFGKMEYVMFDGLGVELCYWAWARDQAELSDQYKKTANEMAERLEGIAASLRKAGK